MKAGKHEDAAALVAAGTGLPLIEDCRGKATEIIETEMSDLGLIQSAVEQAGLYALCVIMGGVVLACFAYPFLYLCFSRQIVRPLRDAATTIAHVSTVIAATVEQHEKTASHPVMVDEAISTIEELEFSFRCAGEAADAAGVRASQALVLAEGGGKTVDQSLAGITDLKEKVSAIAAQTMRLSEQTNQIGAVISLVGDLADQTNMLALNATVEAARAGEHGKGFAVVAAEIRKLADQSRKSTEKVDTMVADIQKATDATVMVTEEGTKTAAHGMELAQATAAAFNDLKSSLRTIGENFHQTQASIDQQLTAVKKVTHAMKASIAQLTDTVQKLKEIV
jgi:methyl-accepting chemotaxis protein